MTAQNHHSFRVRPGMRRGLRTEVPLPTRLVSNEEFPPLPQSAAQRAVEERILAEAGRLAPRLGLSRREFLRRSGGMAVSLLAMNAIFGRFFDVLPVEAADPEAFKERAGDPFFVFDVQVHYVGAGYDPTNAEAGRKGAVSKQGLLGLRRQARRMNPKLASDRGTLEDLSWENFVKEVFLDSETAIGLISTPPGPYPQEAVVPPKEMTHIRDEINRVTQSRRMLAHGLVTPQLGQADLDFMDLQASTLKVDAWKGYTGAPPKGFDRGWFADDEKIAYPMLERARKLGVRRVCLHKGLPLGGRLRLRRELLVRDEPGWERHLSAQAPAHTGTHTERVAILNGHERLLHLSHPRVALHTSLRSMILRQAGDHEQTHAIQAVPGWRRGGSRR